MRAENVTTHAAKETCGRTWKDKRADAPCSARGKFMRMCRAMPCGVSPDHAGAQCLHHRVMLVHTVQLASGMTDMPDHSLLADSENLTDLPCRLSIHGPALARSSNVLRHAFGVLSMHSNSDSMPNRSTTVITDMVSKPRRRVNPRASCSNACLLHACSTLMNSSLSMHPPRRTSNTRPCSRWLRRRIREMGVCVRRIQLRTPGMTQQTRLKEQRLSVNAICWQRVTPTRMSRKRLP